MHYVTIPEPVQPVNPDTDEPIVNDKGEKVMITFTDYIRVLRKDQRVLQGMDMLEAYESTASLIKAKAGTVVPLQDESWQVLQACAKRPTTIGAALIFSPDAASFAKALIDAPTKAPES
jgi:hypothetical protein